MKRVYTVLVPVFLALLFLLGSCVDMLNPPAGVGPVPSGKGRLAVQVAGAARTALPAGSFDRYVLSFAYTGGTEGYTHDPVEWAGGVTVDLEPGNWTVHADAYSRETVAGTGSAAVTVNAGSVTPVTIVITAIKTGAGIKGTLKYTVNYPPADANHAYGSRTLNIASPDGTAVGSPITITNGTEGTVELDAGVYFVTALVEDTVQRTVAARTVSAHIYGGRETVLVIDIEAGDFTAAIPVTGTTQLRSPAGVILSTCGVKAYSDANCTNLVGTGISELLNADGPFTVWVPSTLGTVYLRQEAEIEEAGGGRTLTLSGNKQAVTIPANQTGAVPCGLLSDSFYGITVVSGISNGTITADPFAALSGAEITLTVEPASGYVLKDGTPKYNDGSDHGIAGPSYTFTMPASDITVSAEFIHFVRYVTQNGAGTKDGTSWANASDDLQEMMDELTGLYNTGLYAGPFVVEVGAGTYKPQYKPKADGTTTADDRESAFILRKGVQVWGGYPSGGGDNRDITANVTTLSGDFLGNDSVTGSGSSLSITGNGENAYHVVLAVDIPANSGTVLDGFTIKGGNADGTGDLTVNNYPIGKSNGGGIYNSNYSAPALTNVVISGNSAGSDGGGIYNAFYSSPVLTHVTLSGNSTGSFGGGIYNAFSSSPVLTHVTISGNSASYGGGMYNNGICSPVLTDVTISDNSAGSDGGGIYNSSSSSPMLTGVTISGNSASTGGGMYNSSSSPALVNVTISGNSAAADGGGVSSFGGGMYNSSSSPALVNVTISGNSAAAGGGSTSSYGGGMYNNNSSPVLTNVLISGNAISVDGGSSKIHGGGMYNDNSSPVLTGVTISGNIAGGGHGDCSLRGGGIYNANSSSPQIRNSVIWGNDARDEGPGICNDSSTPVIAYSIVQGSDGSGSWITSTGTDGGNNKDTDPLFVNPDPASVESPKTGGDYRLGVGSPAIGAGDGELYPTNADDTSVFPSGLSDEAKTAINAALAKDLGGANRKNGTIDMGAYEGQ